MLTKINNQPIQISNNIRILGYTYNNTNNSTSHITNICNKASYNIKKLDRFQSAPYKIRKHLYKALIRPILEYPPEQISLTGKGILNKIQKINNRGLRFINGTKLKDRVRTETIYKKAKCTL